MANRLSVITTRTGDDGSTGLGDGTRLSKDAPRVVALGDVDELNSAIGVLRTHSLPADVSADLLKIQHDLFDMGAELCIPGHTALGEEQITHLDARLAHYNASLPPLREFVVPGGSPGAAQAHMARTICRRAERTVVTLARTEFLNPQTRKYLNRLSDLMFVFARYINQQQVFLDVLWNNKHSRRE